MDQIEQIYESDYKDMKARRYSKKLAGEENVYPLYGEITRLGVERILDKFQDQFSDPNTVFYDIGSGYGKMVMHVASVAPIKKCVGVEFFKERNDFAIKESLKYKYKSQQKPSFIQGDAFKLSYDDATIVYSDTTASGFKDAFREHLVPMLPSGCILIMRGDPGDLVDVKGIFKSETTYFENYFARWGVVR